MNLFKMRGGGGLVVLLMVIALIFIFGACDWGKDEVVDDPTAGIIDYYDYTQGGNFSIKVTNSTTKNLVAFRSNIVEAQKLGGIRANTTNHGLKNDSTNFGDSPKQFGMILVEEEKYLAARALGQSALNELQNKREYFTQVFVFWNGTSGDNEKVYEISSRLGGEYQLEVINNSNYHVELRANGPSGPTLGYAPAGMVSNRLYITSGDLLIFPVFKFVNTQRQVVETIIPKQPDGNPWRRPYNFEGVAGLQVLNLGDVLSQITARSTGVASLIIINQTTSGAISFQKGDTVMITPTGTKNFNDQREFIIEMPAASGSSNFASSYSPSNFLIESGGYTTPIVTKENGSTTLTLLADKAYYVYVTGAIGQTDPSKMLKAVVELREDQEGGPDSLTFSELTFTPAL